MAFNIMNNGGLMPSAPDSSTLEPLPPALRHGLTAVAFVASISFASSLSLFVYFTCKLIKWRIRTSRLEVQDAESLSPGADMSLGLSQEHFGAAGRPHPPRRRRGPPNQFVVLVYNLFLADFLQSCAYLLNTAWAANNAILVGTRPCFIQGWLVSNGDLSSSCFITAIAVHTYLVAVRGYRPPQWALYTAIIGIWLFVYGATITGLAVTQNGKSAGGYFVRASAWCWINVEYEHLRLLTHYLYIFMALALTSVLYTLIFLHLRASKRDSAGLAGQRPSSTGSARRPSTTATATTATNPPSLPRPSPGNMNAASIDIHPAPLTGAAPTKYPPSSEPPSEEAAGPHIAEGYHPAFLVYPLIYVVCTLPLALGRMATMAGADVPLPYFCAAGALITSNGWADALLWGTTRRVLVFGRADDVDDPRVGLDTFAFMRTPHDRRFGNMVWVQGAAASTLSHNGTEEGKNTGQRCRCEDSTGGVSRVGPGELAIQMDLVTSVVVEEDHEGEAEAAKEYRLKHGLTMHLDPSAYPMAGNDWDKEGAELQFITSALE